MLKRIFFLLPAAALLAACGTLPRTDKIQKPPYLSIQVDHHETLGEFIVLTPSFKVFLPEAAGERLSYLETQVAEFSRMKLYEANSYGADKTVLTNDKKTVDERLARDGRAVMVTPEALTISAKYRPGPTPRILLTASPNILDGDGALHFSLTNYPAAGKAGPPRERLKLRPAADEGPDPEAFFAAAGQKAAEIRDYLLKKYGATVKLKRSGTVFGADGKPVTGIETELTVFLESARITFNGLVRNLAKSKIWATYYLPQLTCRKGGDWYTFSARRFSDSLKGGELKLYFIGPGAEKKFQFTTDTELRVLAYDSALQKITERNAFASGEENELLKFEILEKYLGGNPDASLEVFPEKIVCESCGVKLY